MKKTNPVQHWRIEFDDKQALSAYHAICHEHISQGPLVYEFEKKLASYLNVPYVVATTSGSIALLMSMMAIGIKHGDEVIVPNRTWIATAHAPYILGANIKLVDVEKDRPIIDARLIEEKITGKTKAIIPVHLGGRAADMNVINEIAKRYNIKVIEDAAQALGSRNAQGLLGTQSDLGCFSLSVAKIISTGQGGFIATRNEDLYAKLIAIRTHGVGDIINAKWDQPGFNFRYTDILAAIGIQQLQNIGEKIKIVQNIYQEYERGLASTRNIKIIPINLANGELPVYVEVLSKNRESLIKYLKENGINCRPFYPSLHKAQYFNNANNFTNSDVFGDEGVYLPSGPGQDIDNIKLVIQCINNFDVL